MGDGPGRLGLPPIAHPRRVVPYLRGINMVPVSVGWAGSDWAMEGYKTRPPPAAIVGLLGV